MFSLTRSRSGFIGICVMLFTIVLYLISREKVFTAELNYAEYSEVLGRSAGGLIPASCESSPPTSHYSGDCPVSVETRFSKDPKTVTSTLTPPNQTVVDSATLYWTSGGGVTKCKGSWKNGWLPANGSATLTVQAYTTKSYSLTCTDGTFWTTGNTVTVSYTYIPYSGY